MKTNLLFINIFLLIASVSLGIFIFHSDTKSSLNKPICERCNVILISLDTLGSNHLPCYGYYRNTANNMCNFAKDNIFFTNFFSNANWTLPSHFSIFTSLYPNHHNIVDYDINKLDPSIKTVTEFFREADYKTMYVGLKKDPSLPLDRGIERGFEILTGPSNAQDLSEWDKAINQLIKNNRKNQSTFLFLHTYFVHDPYVVNYAFENNNKRIYTKYFYEDIPLDWEDFLKFTEDFRKYLINRYKNKIIEDALINKERNQSVVRDLNETRNIVEAEKIYNDLITNPNDRYVDFASFYFSKIDTDGKVSYINDLYDEMIYRLDKEMKKIFELTSNPELAKNTIIIITSDHGEEFKEHGALTHPADHLYNTTTAVPLIMYVPGVKQKKVETLAQSIDILPTILKLTGLTNSRNNFDGKDQTDSIINSISTSKSAFSIANGLNIDSIQNNEWKLYIKYNSERTNPHELYKLDIDPTEEKDVSQDNQKIMEDLLNNLNRIIYKK